MSENTNMIISDEKFSNELKEVLDYMVEEIAKDELPTVVISPEYFFLSVLEIENCEAYKTLNRIIQVNTLDAIEASIVNFLSSKALTAIKPNRAQKYDDKLINYLKQSEEEMKKLGDSEITSDHVMLAILNDDSFENRIRKIINAKRIDYTTYKDLIQHKKNDKNKPDLKIDKTSSDLPNYKLIGIDLSQLPNGDEIMQKLVLGQITPEEIINKYPNAISGTMPTNQTTNSKSKTPNIDSFCTNLNNMVENGKIDEIVGREKETEEIIRILGRRRKNNAILVGSEGVGKTVICENLASKIVKQEVPDFLLNKIVISLDITALQAGTTLRGMFEERVKGLLNEIRDNGNYILFIDNIGNVLNDKGRNDYDISGMISHSLETGEVQVIGTADYKSFRKTFDKDPSLNRRFQKIVVDAPSVEESLDIINGIKHYYEDYHHVVYTNEAIKSCVELSNRYISERNLPDSAIDVLDEAGSIIGTSADSIPEVGKLKKQINDIKFEIDKEKQKENYKRVDELSTIEKSLNSQIKGLTEKHKEKRLNNPEVIDESVILELISKKTKIPVNKLTSDDKKRLLNINNRLKEEVIGQDEAIDTICRALKRNRIGLSNNKCLYSALAVGKTGVGKTLIAKKLAKEMFGTEDALIRFDMSEYHDKTAVNKLIGSNPGYVGYEEGGLLTEAVKNKKYCVLLLDEIEKADPEVYNIFLQVLDEGFLTDNSGMHVDFRNVIVIFTSNVGTKAANDFGKGIGFGENDNSKKILLKELKNRFPPEFINRLTNVIYFNNLTEDNLKEIIKLEIGKLQKRLNKIGYDLKYDKYVIDYILNIIKDEKEYGARPIMRAIQDEIEDKITDLLLEKDYENGYVFNVTYPQRLVTPSSLMPGIVEEEPIYDTLQTS